MKLLRLYPSWWRARYEEEMQALLDQHQVTLRTRIDLLIGALDAWISIGRSDTMVNRRGTRPSAWIVAIPSVFVIAHFLSDIFWLDSLAGLLVWAEVSAWLAICVVTGVWAARNGATVRQAAARGLVIGVVAWALTWVVDESLNLLGIAGIYAWAANLIGASGSTFIDVGTAFRWLFLPVMLIKVAVLALGSASLGAAVAALALKIARWVSQFDIIITRRSQSSVTQR